jgi:heme-degrading monooxygenase HmoA
MSLEEGKPARTPEPPYWAVIFTSRRTEGDHGYAEMSDLMISMASQQPGFLGIETARGEDGLGITVSYWESEEALLAWRANTQHRVAQMKGLQEWYSEFCTRVARVERERWFERETRELPHEG